MSDDFVAGATEMRDFLLAEASRFSAQPRPELADRDKQIGAILRGIANDAYRRIMEDRKGGY
jgi:hypothetical protein